MPVLKQAFFPEKAIGKTMGRKKSVRCLLACRAMINPMPRDGAIIFSDLIGKLKMLRVSCDKCERAGSYSIPYLISGRGGDAKVIDWLDEITADCPKKIAHNMNDPCGARCPQLAKVL
jgi:hypothetical protein